jgi:hypothetical protein
MQMKTMAMTITVIAKIPTEVIPTVPCLLVCRLLITSRVLDVESGRPRFIQFKSGDLQRVARGPRIEVGSYFLRLFACLCTM